MPVEALLLPLRMPLFCSFEIIALVGCGICRGSLLFFDEVPPVGMLLAGAFLVWGRSAFWIFNEVSNIYFFTVHIWV